MYLPYRTVGYVVDSSPVDIKRAGSEHFITASIGSVWQVYKASNLRCVLVAPEREGRIAAIASAGDLTYTAVGRQVIVWKRSHEITRIVPEEGNRIVKLMLVGNILLTLSADRHIYAWDCSDMSVNIAKSEAHQAGSTVKVEETTFKSEQSLYNTINLAPLSHIFIPLPPHNDQNSVITTWCHPPTYTNKIVIGWSSGVMELWNINTCKMIYRFTCLDKLQKSVHKSNKASAFDISTGFDNDKEHKEPSKGKRAVHAITVITPTPALDVVAIGRQNGDIILCNLKLDQVLHSFHQTSGAVTSLAFRTDDDKNPHFVSTCNHGSITLWDLEQRQSIFIHQHAHGGAITTATFLPGEPILITSGRDNAIYQWKFEGITMHPLRSQTGHFAPPTCVRFFSAREMLTGGKDKTLRYWSPMRDRAAQTLSWSNIKTSYARQNAKEEGFIEPSARHIVDLDVCPLVLESTNISAVTLTGVSDKAVLWSVENKRAEKLVGLGASAAVKACFSFCGNFVFIAYKEGTIKKFNIESGIFRGLFTPSNVLTTSHSDRDLKKTKDKHLARKLDALSGQKLLSGSNAVAHPSGVIGLFCTMANQSLISVGVDGLIYAWDIAQCAVQQSIQLDSTVTYAAYASELQLLAVATADSMIQIIDTTRCIVVRKWTIKRRIACCQLYPLHGLLLVADVIGGLSTFDLASGALIDWSMFSLPITSLDICPVVDGSFGSDLIATTHTDSLGVHLWVVNTSKQSIVSVPKTATRVAVGSSNVDHSDDASVLLSSIRDDQDDYDEDDEDSSDEESRRFKLVNTARKADCDAVYQTIDANTHLTTLSGIRASRWKLLTQQRAIAQRNALHVSNALKQREVPFFLNIKTGQKKRDVDEINAEPLLAEHNPFALKDKAFKLDIGKSELLNLATNVPVIKMTMDLCYCYVHDGDDEESDDVFVSLADPHSLVADTASPEQPSSRQKKQLKAKKGGQKNKNTDGKQHRIADDIDDSIDLTKDNYVDPTPYLMQQLSRDDHMALIPLTQYLLAASPASIAVQLTECSSPKHLHAMLHALYLIIIQTSSNIDAIASILSYTLDQHSILIAKHPALRTTSKLLLKVSSEQWKTVEQLLQSNIAVINHLCGMHSQL